MSEPRDFQINFNDVVPPQFIPSSLLNNHNSPPIIRVYFLVYFHCSLFISPERTQPWRELPTLSSKSYSIIIIQIHSPTWNPCHVLLPPSHIMLVYTFLVSFNAIHNTEYTRIVNCERNEVAGTFANPNNEWDKCVCWIIPKSCHCSLALSVLSLVIGPKWSQFPQKYSKFTSDYFNIFSGLFQS